MPFAQRFPFYMTRATARRLLRASQARRAEVLRQRELCAALRVLPRPMVGAML